MPRDPKLRFTDRVDAYSRYRPTYPQEVFDLLKSRCGLETPRRVADVGSGTGILTRPFLERGHTVFAVEPNKAMRRAAERTLAGSDSFYSVDGAAEATSLPDDSIHLIVSGQAFHWFDLDQAHREFGRILKPGGWVAILWNDRRKTSTPFLRGYEELLIRHGTDYQQVDHTRLGHEELATFFGTTHFETSRFGNHQRLDFDGLRGRLESSSYVPTSGASGYEPMIAHLRILFDAHSSAGTVTIDYDTLLYCGQLGAELS